MRRSVFSAFAEYLGKIFYGMKTIFESCRIAVPYLFGAGDLRKEVTEQYPDPISAKVPDDLPARSRGLLFNDIDRCTGCKECEQICPSQCIRVMNEAGPTTGKNWVALFEIQFSKCIFCGLCVSVCEPRSLVHTKQYEGAAYTLADLVANFGRGQVTAAQREKWALARQQAESEELSI